MRPGAPKTLPRTRKNVIQRNGLHSARRSTAPSRKGARGVLADPARRRRSVSVSFRPKTLAVSCTSRKASRPITWLSDRLDDDPNRYAMRQRTPRTAAGRRPRHLRAGSAPHGRPERLPERERARRSERRDPAYVGLAAWRKRVHDGPSLAPRTSGPSSARRREVDPRRRALAFPRVTACARCWRKRSCSSFTPARPAAVARQRRRPPPWGLRLRSP